MAPPKAERTISLPTAKPTDNEVSRCFVITADVSYGPFSRHYSRMNNRDASVRKRPRRLRRGHTAHCAGWCSGHLRVLHRNPVQQVTGHGEMLKHRRQMGRGKALHLRILARSYDVFYSISCAMR